MAVPSDEWEICVDEGFIYKRRRRSSDDLPSAASPPPSPEADEAKLRRSRRKKRRSCLIGLKEQYRSEMEQWERVLRVSVELNERALEFGSDAMEIGGGSRADVADLEGSSRGFRSVDELLAQAESQEAILRKMNEICDHIDALCEQKEEKLFNSHIELPIWGSPQSLYESITTL